MFQVMAMDGHSKNVFLIGVLHIVGYGVFSLEPIVRSIQMVYFDDFDSDEWAPQQFSILLGAVGFFILIQVLTGLMLRGVVKKRFALLIPFFVMSSLVLGSKIVLLVIDIAMDKPHFFYHFKDCLFDTGLYIMTLYPVYTLFSKLRSQAEKEKSVQVISSEDEKASQDLLTKKLDV